MEEGRVDEEVKGRTKERERLLCSETILLALCPGVTCVFAEAQMEGEQIGRRKKSSLTLSFAL